MHAKCEKRVSISDKSINQSHIIYIRLPIEAEGRMLSGDDLAAGGEEEG